VTWKSSVGYVHGSTHELQAATVLRQDAAPAIDRDERLSVAASSAAALGILLAETLSAGESTALSRLTCMRSTRTVGD